MNKNKKKYINKIKIKLKSFDNKLVDFVIKEIINISNNNKINISGPIFLPSIKKKFIVLTSPHANKDAREQFELCTHKRLIYLIKCNTNLIDSLMRLNIPSGVCIKINFI